MEEGKCSGLSTFVGWLGGQFVVQNKSMASRFGEKIKGEVKKRRTLSANKHNLFWWPLISKPWMFGLERIRRARGSIARAKGSGERGQPWCVPRSMGKGSKRSRSRKHKLWDFGIEPRPTVQNECQTPSGAGWREDTTRPTCQTLCKFLYRVERRLQNYCKILMRLLE